MMSDRLPRRPVPLGAPSAESGESITPSELLAEHLSGASARAVGEGRRTLVARGMAFATVGPDPAGITPVCAVSARDLPVVDVLAALAAQDPSGVLVIETSDDAFVFEVDRGRLTGARGLGPLDQLEPFVAEVHRRHPQRFGPDEEIGPDHPAWMKVARAFVEERVLDQLTLGRVPGTRMTLIRGDVEWLGTRLPPGVGPTLGHVLLEHARRFDEMPKVLGSVGDLERVAVPLAEPGERPLPPANVKAADDWDFFSDPDPAAIAEWNDALAVWSLCDGETPLREIIDATMLGHFRGLLALRTLVKARCIVVIDAPIQPRRLGEAAPVTGGVEADVIPLRSRGAESRPAVEAEPGDDDVGTGYSIVARRAPGRIRSDVVAPASRVERRPPPPPRVDLEPRRPTPVEPAPRRPTPAGTSASRRASPPTDVAALLAARAEAARRPTPRDFPTELPCSNLATHDEWSARLDGPLEHPSAAAILEPGGASDTAEQASAGESFASGTRPASESQPSAAISIRAARTMAVGRALEGALPSPATVMIVLGVTGIVAFVASLSAIL